MAQETNNLNNSNSSPQDNYNAGNNSLNTTVEVSADVSNDNSIRNIIQTVQEREVTKTAPDLITYLNGKAYLINPYVSSSIKGNSPSSRPSSQEFSYVPFNDHIQSFQSSYDVDTLIPAGSITLQVPNHQKYLYQSPGGNNLIETMMEVQVYAKGYFPSQSGNTVYHRVFKGLTTNVTHNDNGTILQIQIQIQGILHFLDFMYTDLSPAALSYSLNGQQPLISNQAKMNPYEMLADIFGRSVGMDSFQRTSIIQSEDPDWKNSVKAGYINKWGTILDNIRREVHILGYRGGPNVKSDKDLPVPDTADNGSTKHTPEGVGTQTPQLLASRYTITPAVSFVQQVSNSDYNVDIIRQYHMDMGIGTLNLINGKITSHLERIKTIVQILGYEGYQDVDGTVIFKPPLYNLDVTNVGQSLTSANTGTVPTSVAITEATNPFVVNLSEIESENEGEDEQGIRATRITVQLPYAPNNISPQDANSITRPAVAHTDIPKLAKFGLREEPARNIPWLSFNDKFAAYTYAVCELNRANRGWRNYSITIPLRPELKLGFPMYLPHKDMYGYIKNISITYQQGGTAVMTVNLDSLRKRPMFPAKHMVSAAENQGQSKDVTIYTTQPNLVMQWTEPPTASSEKKATGSTPATKSDPPYATNVTNKSASRVTNGASSPDTNAVKTGSPATSRTPLSKPVYQEDLEVLGARQAQWGTSWQTAADTSSKSWRVQKDVATENDTTYIDSAGKKTSTGIVAGKPYFSAENWMLPQPTFDANGNPIYSQGTNGQQNGVNPTTKKGINPFYMQKIRTAQPYTDEGGYELMTPFPWGRWKTLKQALLETRLGIVSPDPVDSLNAQVLAGTNAFLFAGVASPQAIDPSNNLSTELNKLNDLSSFAASATSFEIVTPPPGTPPSNGTTDTQPDAQKLDQLDSVTTRTDFFITGSNAPSSDYRPLLREVTPPTGTPPSNDQLTILLGVASSAGSDSSQGQSFISKQLAQGSTAIKNILTSSE